MDSYVPCTPSGTCVVTTKVTRLAFSPALRWQFLRPWGIAFASNLFTLFLFYEILTFSTYPLVTHYGNAEAKRAGRIYMGILLTTSVAFLLLGIMATYYFSGTMDFKLGGILNGKVQPWQAMILLGLFAFGTGKAALMPFHKWLPNAMVAPTPVSALLHAVAIVKAGGVHNSKSGGVCVRYRFPRSD